MANNKSYLERLKDIHLKTISSPVCEQLKEHKVLEKIDKVNELICLKENYDSVIENIIGILEKILDKPNDCSLVVCNVNKIDTIIKNLSIDKDNILSNPFKALLKNGYRKRSITIFGFFIGIIIAVLLIYMLYLLNENNLKEMHLQNQKKVLTNEIQSLQKDIALNSTYGNKLSYDFSRNIAFSDNRNALLNEVRKFVTNNLSSQVFVKFHNAIIEEADRQNDVVLQNALIYYTDSMNQDKYDDNRGSMSIYEDYVKVKNSIGDHIIKYQDLRNDGKDNSIYQLYIECENEVSKINKYLSLYDKINQLIQTDKEIYELLKGNKIKTVFGGNLNLYVYVIISSLFGSCISLYLLINSKDIKDGPNGDDIVVLYFRNFSKIIVGVILAVFFTIALKEDPMNILNTENKALSNNYTYYLLAFIVGAFTNIAIDILKVYANKVFKQLKN